MSNFKERTAPTRNLCYPNADRSVKNVKCCKSAISKYTTSILYVINRAKSSKNNTRKYIEERGWTKCQI